VCCVCYAQAKFVSEKAATDVSRVLKTVQKARSVFLESVDESRLSSLVGSWGKFCALTDLLEFSLSDISEWLPRCVHLSSSTSDVFVCLHCFQYHDISTSLYCVAQEEVCRVHRRGNDSSCEGSVRRLVSKTDHSSLHFGNVELVRHKRQNGKGGGPRSAARVLMLTEFFIALLSAFAIRIIVCHKLFGLTQQS
jgi:hypothetical protein